MYDKSRYWTCDLKKIKIERRRWVNYTTVQCQTPITKKFLRADFFWGKRVSEVKKTFFFWFGIGKYIGNCGNLLIRTFHEVCEGPEPHRASVGTTAKAFSLWEVCAQL